MDTELEVAQARKILQLRIALDQVRSHLRSLPCTATARRIDEICAEALEEPRTSSLTPEPEMGK